MSSVGSLRSSRRWTTVRPGTVALAATLAGVMAFAGRAEARCAGSFERTWPDNGATDVPTNTGLVVVFGSGGGVAAELPALQLRSERDRPVSLRVVLDQLAGDGFRPQRTLLLVPERTLRPHAGYRLSATFGTNRVVASFRTGQGPDEQAPRLAAARAGAFSVAEYGCGPAHQIALELTGAADDRGPPRLARVRLARDAASLDAGRLAGDVIVPIDEDGQARLGHSMCFGNWPLEPGDHFVARVSVLDAALHESPPLPPLTLDAR